MLLLPVCRALGIPHRVGADDTPKMLLVQEADVPLMNLLGAIVRNMKSENFYVAALVDRLKDAKFSRALMSAYMLGGVAAAHPMLEEFLKPKE
jgi:hypothetical protein